MSNTIPPEDYLRDQLENKLAEYGITHLAIQDVRPEGDGQVVANLNDTRNHQAVKILIDRETGRFLDVNIGPTKQN